MESVNPSLDTAHKFEAPPREEMLGHGVRIEAPFMYTYGYNLKPRVRYPVTAWPRTSDQNSSGVRLETLNRTIAGKVTFEFITHFQNSLYMNKSQ